MMASSFNETSDQAENSVSFSDKQDICILLWESSSNKAAGKLLLQSGVSASYT